MTVKIPATAWTDPNQHRVMKTIEDKVNAASVAIAGLTGLTGSLELVALEQVWPESVTLPFADDGSYPLDPKASFEWTIDSVTTIANTGTCTATLTIDGVPLGGGANAASTALLTVDHTSANVLPVDGALVLTISASASCEGLVVKMAGRRTFVKQ